MAKKLLAVLLSATMLATALTACGSTEKKDDAGKEDKEVVLTVFDGHAFGHEHYDEMVKAFEKDHPGVKVEVQHAANDYMALLQSRVNSNNVPDVFDAEAGSFAQQYYDYAYDWTNDKEVTSLFQEEALAMGKDENGKVMSLPWTYENMGVLYNKDCFEKAGITALPTNLDELEDACKKLEAVGITPFAVPAKEAWVLGQISTHFMMDKKLDAAGTVEAIKSGELKFKDMPHWNNFFKFLDLTMEYGTEKPLELDWETSENMLANGKAAMIHMGDWCQATLDSFNPDAKLGFLPVPVGAGADDATLLSSCNWAYMVNKDSKNLELAKEYCAYILTSEMGQKWMCEGIGAVPGVKTDMEVKGTLANDAKTYIAEGKVNGWIHTLGHTSFLDDCGAIVQSYLLGEMSAEEVTDYYQEFWTTK